MFQVITGLLVETASVIVHIGSKFRSSRGYSEQFGEFHGNQAFNL